MGINVSIENDVPNQQIKGGIMALTGHRISHWDFNLLPEQVFTRRTKHLLSGVPYMLHLELGDLNKKDNTWCKVLTMTLTPLYSYAMCIALCLHTSSSDWLRPWRDLSHVCVAWWLVSHVSSHMWSHLSVTIWVQQTIEHLYYSLRWSHHCDEHFFTVLFISHC